ncbi:MAG: hypothetical protein KY453_02545, partial [Gemmatimonadetes bacterium]|nr:hypothetical protein [Gemmatimonadota bacterium]
TSSAREIGAGCGHFAPRRRARRLRRDQGTPRFLDGPRSVGARCGQLLAAAQFSLRARDRRAGVGERRLCGAQRLGGLDHIVVTAGILRIARLSDCSAEDIAEVLRA